MVDPKKVDKVRASRDGHEYHETWAARRAMQLLWPDSDLVAIAIEGLSPSDQQDAVAEAADIADFALYYGSKPNFKDASRVTVGQFKYSVADKDTDFRASHAKKTITKFAETFQDYKRRYGAAGVHEKLDFELATNRPIYCPLLTAIDAIAQEQPTTGEVAKQASQFINSSELTGRSLVEFAAKFNVVGLNDSLAETRGRLASLLVDWSATKDASAAARLGRLRQMVRDKAGHVGMDQNLIVRTDILAALEIGDAADLLPCRSAIADVGVGKVVPREQLTKTIELIPKLSSPLLVHAAGGVGKTVFMDSLACSMQQSCESVFFDCFGGGAYRSPEDGRHLPQNGLIHIANTLAFRGLCDPILPSSNDVESLFRTFRKRLEQSIETLRRANKEGELVIFIDAIDNAILVAGERREDAFPGQLLESLHQKPIPGLKLVVSCRTERKPSSCSRYQDLELQPFSKRETTEFLRSRLTGVTRVEIDVAQARSGGNPRVLEHLVTSDRGLLDASEVNKRTVLDDLIKQRIVDAVGASIERGQTDAEVAAFLAGLAVLPPPVPLDDYADAHGIESSLVVSFAADLAPLIERTSQGLMFRDEPTETLVRNQYASNVNSLRMVAEKLSARQDTSVYAARALPGILLLLDDGAQLSQLAFDERFPASITSTVGKRNIRLARIQFAVKHATQKKNHNRLVGLLVELSMLASIDQRGASYILGCPDLVIAAQDVDATRRLFEAKTPWPGARHARLSIANTLAGNPEEANRHAVATKEWFQHYRNRDESRMRNEAGPEHIDVAAIPFLYISDGLPEKAVRFLDGWRDWYSFEVCEHIFGYIQLTEVLQSLSAHRQSDFLKGLHAIGPLASALSFGSISTKANKDLVSRLYKKCKRATDLKLKDGYSVHKRVGLQDGLRKAAAIALAQGQKKEALIISLRAPHRRPALWSFRDSYLRNDIFPFIFRVALVAAAKGDSVHARDVLPEELASISSRISKCLSEEQFRTKLKGAIERQMVKAHEEVNESMKPRTLSYEDKSEAERFINRHLHPLLELTEALARFLAASSRQANKRFVELVDAWESTRQNTDHYGGQEFDRLFSQLGLKAALFAMWSRSDLKLPSIGRFLEIAHQQKIGAEVLIEVTAILAKRNTMQALAGEQALMARQLIIDMEDDVKQRTHLYASLAHAILPASMDDGAVYFRDGLEQMDAIGSGDYGFTEELLLFASTVRGTELAENHFHTLANICELNMGEEPEKFFWDDFAKGMSKVAGPRGLARLSRWDDRARIGLSYTLLPYLTALVEDGKLEPELAVSLNTLANPVELRSCSTKDFSEAIWSKVGPTNPKIISELINQFELDNPSMPMDETLGALSSIAEQTFGGAHEVALHLKSTSKHYGETRRKRNEQLNYRGASDARLSISTGESRPNNREAIQAIVSAVDVVDKDTLSTAISNLNKLRNAFDLKGEVFCILRAMVAVNNRAQYAKDIISLENLNSYWKLAELKECKQAWGRSSAALDEVFSAQAATLVRLHADELVSHDSLSGYQLNEMAELTGVSVTDLALELIGLFASPDHNVSGAIWLALASLVSKDADESESSLALERLLGSGAAELANNVVDGEWAAGLYPDNNVAEISAALIWRMLGSPHAIDRWRGAHSMRRLAGFGRWDVIDAVVNKLGDVSAGPFQAAELTFYFLHARLWLLIALARLAPDYPVDVARYKKYLISVATEAVNPHVLMRHFAARALVACLNAEALKVRSNVDKQLRTLDLSPHPRLKKKISAGGGFYAGRPTSAPKAGAQFHLKYDFHNQDVDNLSQVFGQPCWQVEDMMANRVHDLDPTVTHMYDNGGREQPSRRTYPDMSPFYHSYGEQLGWHALFFAAGKLLRNFPVTDDWLYDDPWGEWLSEYLLARNDGLWLSDVTDRTPIDAAQFLLEDAKDGLELTGDSSKLKKLIGINHSVGKELVIKGAWHSADNIRVQISSALAPKKKSNQMARSLVREEPMIVWVPSFQYSEDGHDTTHSKKKDYFPWVFHEGGEARLDECDPFGVACATYRPRLSQSCNSELLSSNADGFGRFWETKRGALAVRTEAWGRENRDLENGPYPGHRLFCSKPALKRLLRKLDKDLLLLVKLQKYESSSYREKSRCTHTVAVVRVDQDLTIDYYKGAVNKVYGPKF